MTDYLSLEAKGGIGSRNATILSLSQTRMHVLILNMFSGQKTIYVTLCMYAACLCIL